MAFEDEALTDYEKRLIMLRNLYKEIPENTTKAMELAGRFMNGGDTDGVAEPAPYRTYSFKQDARLIFAAFKQTHGVDLDKEDMHWWKFLALFADMGADTTFCGLVALRDRVKSGKATKQEREIARRMGESFEIEEIDDRTIEEREMELEFLQKINSRKVG